MNSITKRVEEFLVQFPPFDRGTEADLKLLSESVEVRYLEAGAIIFDALDQPQEHFYVVRQGSVKIIDDDDLIDICDEGDIFGARPLLIHETYLARAETLEESLLYAIPVSVGKSILNSNAQMALFFAMGYASGKPMQRHYITEDENKVEQRAFKQSQKFSDINETVPPNYPTNVLTCPSTASIEDAANAMTERGVGSIVITEGGLPLGIITDKDFRKNVATGIIDRSAAVTTIMSHPVLTVKKNISVVESMMEMVRLGVHHLCVTEDGSNKSMVAGIISDHDLLLVQGNNPAIVIKEIKKVDHIPTLINLRARADELIKKYLNQEISMPFVRKVASAVNDTLYQKLIALAIEELGQIDVKFAWLNLGSGGREEQILRTDQDHALIFEDVENVDETIAYFMAMAEHVSKNLEKFGFEQDVANIGANHQKWCQPLFQWKKYFNTWIHSPDEDNILLSNIFFDFRRVYGDQELTNQLADHLYQEIETEQIFVPLLARNALTNPAPLSFFRNFVVEKGGGHKDRFDLKLRALLPLTDAARVFTLQHKIKGINNTSQRFIKLSKLEPENGDIFKEAAHAYDVLLRIRAKFGFKNNDDGRYIDPEILDKLDRQTLRNIFSTIDDLQKILKVRFQSNLLG